MKMPSIPQFKNPLGKVDTARLLPQTRIAGPMPWVMAIMVALTVIAVAAALALGNIAQNARAEISGGLTIQIVEGAPASRDRQAEAVTTFFETRSDVESIRLVPEEELSQLLEPWLGGAIEEDDVIATPALIDVQLNSQIDAESLRSIREDITRLAPEARVDAQANWLAPVLEALRSLGFLALGLVLLLSFTAIAAVWLAARSALDTNHETIEVIHHLGATDGQIASIFQRSIASDAALGGFAGLLLGLAAVLVLSAQFTALGSGLVAGGGLSFTDWLIILTIPLFGILLAVLTARITILHVLRQLL